MFYTPTSFFLSICLSHWAEKALLTGQFLIKDCSHDGEGTGFMIKLLASSHICEMKCSGTWVFLEVARNYLNVTCTLKHLSSKYL